MRPSRREVDDLPLVDAEDGLHTGAAHQQGQVDKRAEAATPHDHVAGPKRRIDVATRPMSGHAEQRR